MPYKAFYPVAYMQLLVHDFCIINFIYMQSCISPSVGVCRIGSGTLPACAIVPAAIPLEAVVCEHVALIKGTL